MTAPHFDAAVVGGGVAGLASAWHLARMGAGRVALLERFALAHPHGSSHGAARITRSSYADATHVGLMQVAHHEDWPRLEQAADARLVHHCDGVFFGPADGPFEDYAAAVAAAGVDVERLSPVEARRRFPAFTFVDAAGVLHDRTGGLIDAAATIAALARVCAVEGVYVHEHSRVIAWQALGDRVRLETERGAITATRLVIAAGAWAASLVPALGKRLTVKRQSVGYWPVLGDPAASGPGRFPVWAYFGPGPNGLAYGLPRYGAPGLKAAFHETAGAADDPDAAAPPDEGTLAGVESFLRAQLTLPLAARVHAETCLYTNSDDEDFIIDTLPEAANTVIVSACSGHGFKFAPTVGRIAASLALTGRSGVPEFESARARFAL